MKQKVHKNPNLIQKRFYNHIKKKALSLESGHSREMRVYFQGQQKYLKRNFVISNAKSLFDAVERSQVIFIGDFHTFDQSGRNLERLIRFMLDERAQERRITLGMEMVMHHCQIHVDNFLTGHISEDELLESINYHDSWRFPWTHYRAFFQMAKKHGIKILALNSIGSLKQRDQKAAKLICQHLDQDQKNKIFVLFGEAHIFPNKLPMKVYQESQKQIKHTIIHQNIDEVFWKMPVKSNRRKNQDQIVSFSHNEYCLLTSPPWVKYESMVYWYENISDDPEFDLHSAHFEQGLKRFTENSHETFLYLLEHLWAAMLTNEARPSMTQLSDFNLYDSSKIDYLINHGHPYKTSKKIDHRRPASQIYVEASLAKGRPFPIPGAFHYYSPSYSFNRLVLLAGIHLYTYRRGKGTLKNLIEKGSAEGRFVYFINMEMVSYYCSKIINPYRKCDLYKDLQRKSRSSTTPLQQRNLVKIALKFLSSGPKSIKATITKKRPLILHDIARILGPLMAELAIGKFQLSNSQSDELHGLLFNGELNLQTYIRLRELCCGDLKQLKSSKKRFF